jgi:hypothetical protein
MPYCISEVRHREFPAPNAVAAALSPLGIQLDELIAAFRGYICPLNPTTGRGYETELAEDLKGYLAKALQRDGLRPTSNRLHLTYSRSLHDHADFGIVHERTNRTVFVEMGFRHNYERDLLKFQIGASEGTLAAAVLVLSIDPKTIDATFSTMPSYESVTKVIDALKPAYPLVVVGLRGAHAA